jgi:uncharacterized protein YndB with AHSA1/START domain
MSAVTDTDVVEKEIRIAAPPDVVFPYLIETEKMILWMGMQAELDPKPGGVYWVNVNGRDKARGKYLEVVPHRRVRFTWGWEGEGSPLPPGTTTVEITLQPDGEGTLLRLRHTGLPKEAQASHAEGWVHYLARLADAGVGRDPGPDSFAM